MNKMRYLFLDIETTPIEINNEEVKRYLMDKKIGESRKLDPNYAKIILLCVKFLNSEDYIIFEGEEKEILERFWNFMKENKDAMIVTHNGYNFDVPFLIIRSCVSKVNIPIEINMNRWNMGRSNHFDTMLFFSSQGSFTNPNLDILARLNGIEVLGDRIEGRDIEKLYKKGDIEKIKEHCKRDIYVLEKVFEKLCLGYLSRKIV